MRIMKRNGSSQDVDVSKVVKAIERCSYNLKYVDPLKIATKTISGIYDNATTKEIDNLAIQTAASLTAEEPEYSKLAGRILARYIDKEVEGNDIFSFSQSIDNGFEAGLISERVKKFVDKNKRKLNAVIVPERNDLFEYFGLRTVYDRYLFKSPISRLVIETPQYFWLRVACGLSDSVPEVINFYNLFSTLEYVPSTPTLFNSGSQFEQLSSCYLLDSPLDDLEAIYDKYKDVAKLSKFSGGIGLSFSRVRSFGSLIKGTNGPSTGIIPFLKTLDSSVAAVNQGSRRRGSACVYLSTWHADIESFLELRDNTGDEQRRTHNLNLANWIPDLFMKRVNENGTWSLFDPKVVPHFVDLYGAEFEAAYIKAEEDKLFAKQIKAQDLWTRMLKTLAQTGNGWMTFQDASNNKGNQVGDGNVIHSSNLCVEILEVNDTNKTTSCCNLGSLNLSKYVADDKFDFAKLAKNIQLAITQLDKVIDINFYPIQSAQASNSTWRPVGLGLMGLADVFFQLKLPFESDEAKKLSTKIQEEIYFHALTRSCELAEKLGAHANFKQTKAAKGILQFDMWGITPENTERWNKLKEKIKKHGLRNSLMIAIAPTATIASISGCYECIEPQASNIFKRETLSGDFIQINKYLVSDLKNLGLWSEEMKNKIILNKGSIQNLAGIPDAIKELYKVVWEIKMRSLIDMAAARGAFIDQSQSLNLFIESPNIGKLSTMYNYAWQVGLKTTYYLRSRPATEIAQVVDNTLTTSVKDDEAIACSIEAMRNGEECESCQ